MRIWHVGAASNPHRVDGVSRTVWLLSREQARLGHDVSLIVDTPPDDAARQMAAEAKMRLIEVHSSYFNYSNTIRRILHHEQPDVVHMHSVFILRQALLGRTLKELGIPYIITPHGGLAPQVLKRGIIKKTLYSWLQERGRFMDAAAVAMVSPAEERAVRSFIPGYRKIVRWMPNPVDTRTLGDYHWEGPETGRLIFLGRFDVLVKGIDILFEIARLLPEFKVELYGTEDPKTLSWLQRLKRNQPPNLSFHAPIFGKDKAKMLAGASLYLQPSRWEGFPVSVAECLSLGVPSAIADTLDLAQLFGQQDLGLVLPLDPPSAAAKIRSALADQKRLHAWSERGREFAALHFDPQKVAERHIELYGEVARRHPQPDRNGHALPANHNGSGYSSVRTLLPVHYRSSIKAGVTRFMERGYNAFSTENAARTIVLCYHSVNRNSADLAVDPKAFREQLLVLRDMGYSFVNFGELVHRLMKYGAPHEKLACITLDDGYEDNLTLAAPVLTQLSIPATVFVTSGLMAGEQSVVESFRRLTSYQATYLSPSQVRELDQMGIEIGAHTHTHPNLAQLSLAAARDEVVRSKTIIEQALGKTVRSFAYPFGKRGIHYTPDTVAIVREAAFGGAAAVAFRSVTNRNAIRVFEIPRFFVNRIDSAEVFRQKIRGYFDWLGAIQENAPAWMKSVVSPEDRR